jgi:predicted NUDIX family NTP pyrophosphohydrolase
MAEHSAGILLWRLRDGTPEVFLVHQGGPFWAQKDDAAWSIPKGAIEPGEDALAAARREFAEETGLPIPDGALQPLGDFRYSSGKLITVFAIRGDADPATLRPGTFTMEWPPHSGRTAEFPEVDRAAWFGLAAAEPKLVRGQRPLLSAFAARFAR